MRFQRRIVRVVNKSSPVYVKRVVRHGASVEKDRYTQLLDNFSRILRQRHTKALIVDCLAAGTWPGEYHQWHGS